MRDILEGSMALAEAVKLCRPAVIAAYPITPQTHIVEDLASMIANGELDSEYVMVESEHSAMSACLGAQATGVRTYTATSAQGLALMWEMLYIVSGMRMPVVMTNANRALSAPISIWNDQQDSIGARDSGWIQLYGETNQEIADTSIQAYMIGENHDVLLPVMVNMDGFTLTHTVEPVDIPAQEDVDSFLPPYKPLYELNPASPVTMGPIAFPDSFMEFRKQQHDAMGKALNVIKKTNEKFSDRFGRSYGDGLLEFYNMENADYAIVAMGSIAGTVKHVLDRAENSDVGLVRIRCYRPFPKDELKNALKDVESIGVIEKNIAPGFGGAVGADLRSIGLYNTHDFIAGLGGRDVRFEDIERIISEIRSAGDEDDLGRARWINVGV